MYLIKCSAEFMGLHVQGCNILAALILLALWPSLLIWRRDVQHDECLRDAADVWVVLAISLPAAALTVAAVPNMLHGTAGSKSRCG